MSGGSLAPLAHGVGTRADLPVPIGYAIAGAAVAVLVSFAALGVLWRTPKLTGDRAGRPLPAGLSRVVDSTATTVVLRVVVLALTLLVVTVALTGPTDPPANLAVYVFYITFWVGLVPASLLLGPVWARVNPLRSIHWALEKVTGPPPGSERLPAVGYWPAAAALAVYGWLELCYPDRTVPANVGVFLVTYGVVQLVAALWFGEQWFARGDGFEVTSTLFGRLAPFGRREDGRLVLRNPLDGVDGVVRLPGLSAVVVVLVGITAFDGVTRTRWWQDGYGIAGDARVLPQTLGLIATVALVAALYVGATRLTGRADGPSQFAHTIVPIAVGYAVAHYFSLLLLDGQLTWILASDPFQTGADYFGTAANAIDYSAVSPDTIAIVQIVAIVVGHVLGVVLAHDRAVRLTPGRKARTSQYPLLLVMVAFTTGGLGLLLGT